MPVYRLIPVDLEDRDWEASTHRRECRVHAADEKKARQYASKKFLIATHRVPGEDIKVSPWTQESKVTVQELTDYTPAHYREGMIEVPDTNRSFQGVDVDGEPSIDDLADFDSQTPYRVVTEGDTSSSEEASSRWGKAKWGQSNWGVSDSDVQPLGHDPCEICHTTAETMPATGGDFLHQNCPRCGEFKLSGTAASMLRKRRATEFIAKLSGWVHDHQGNEPPMIMSEVIEDVESSKALSLSERSQRLLLEAFRGQEKLGDTFNINEPHFIAASHSHNKDEVQILYKILVDQGLIKAHSMGGSTEILPNGYIEAEKLNEEAFEPDVEAHRPTAGTAPIASTVIANGATGGGGFSNAFSDGFDKAPPTESKTSVAGTGVAQTNSDSAGRDVVDHLEVTVEAENIARYISLRALDTPMSIALFGDWGSGKSFLLNKIQGAVEDISNQSGPLHKEGKSCAYCNGVVPIEFNAWHYIESNLWASLTAHIFDSLNDWLETQDVEKEKITALFQELDTAKQEKVRAELEIEVAESVQDEREKGLVEARSTLKINQEELQKNTPKSIWIAVKNTILNTPELATSIDKAGKELGFDNLKSSAENLQIVLNDVKSLSGRGHLAFTALKSRGGLYVIAGLSLLVVPSLIALGLHKADLGLFSEGVGAMGGIMATLTAWLGLGMSHARKAISTLEDFGGQLEKYITSATENYQKDLVAAEAAVEASRGDVALAETRLSESQKKVDDLKHALQETTPQARLNTFIRNQVAKEEYTKHLGLVSTIRRDFEKLSKLMAPGEKEWSDAAKVEDELGSAFKISNSFERIILYIDDLDRCPPDKVVEVLQAIHLLLAFPLFVVVVAVDARWVARALKDHYPTLLIENVAFDLEHTSASVPGSNETNDNGKPKTDLAASSHDYLEKIFQVPYWVKPVDEVSSQKFVDGLLALEPKAYDKTESVKVVVGGEQVKDQNSDVVVGSNLGGRRKRKTNLKPEFDPNPVAAEISGHERDYIQVMAPFIGNSPRRLKRFINLYRLIKAGLSKDDAETFVGEKGEALDYRAVLTNLAIVTGAPNFAPEYFRLLPRVYRKRTGPYGENFDELIEVVHPEDATISHERARVEGALNKFSELTNADSDKKLQELRRWSRSVSRFSFTTRPE